MWLVPAAIATAVTAPVVAAPDDRHAAALIAGAVAAIAPFVIPAVFGNQFRGAVAPLELLLPGVVLYAPVNVLVVYLSVRRAEPWWSLAVAVGSMLVTVGAALLLIPGHGARGAAAGSSIGYAVGAALAWALFAGLSHRRSAVSGVETSPGAAQDTAATSG